MKAKHFILIFFLTSTVLKGQITFQKTYDASTTFSDFGRDVQQTADGGFIITGATSLGAGPSDLYLLKTTSDGTVQWGKSFGGAGNENGHCVQQTTDGGFIIVGNTDTYVGGGPWDIYLVKTAFDGTLQWSKTFGGTGIEEGRFVRETNDGGFIITGMASDSGGLSMCLFKTAFDGTLQWASTYGSAMSTDGGESVKQTDDGGYIITGSTTINGSYDVYLVKTASDGTLQWTQTFGDSLMDMGYAVEQTNDGGFIVSGTFGRSRAIGLGTIYYGDIYLIKTSSDGTLQWTKTFGDTLHAVGYNVQQTNDGGYLICGERNGAYLVKTSSIGSLQWAKCYGNLLGANGKTAAQQTNDGGFIMTGTIINAGTGFDVYLIKTDSVGNSGCNETIPTTIVGSGGIQNTGGVQGTGSSITSTIATQTFNGGTETTLCLTTGENEITEKSLVSIFPNPFSSQTTLNIDKNLHNATLTVNNYFGQAVAQIKNINGRTITFDRGNLSSGLYFIRLTEDNKIIATEKVVIND